MIKTIVIFYCLLNACLVFAEPLNDESLKVDGRALANYQICSQIAGKIGDEAMLNYYLEMFNDSSSEISRYPKKQSEIVFKAFHRSVAKLSRIDKQSMGKFCLSRFDPLSRKVQEKKLSAQ